MLDSSEEENVSNSPHFKLATKKHRRETKYQSDLVSEGFDAFDVSSDISDCSDETEEKVNIPETQASDIVPMAITPKKIIGSGKYGVVMVVEHQEEKYAVKVVRVRCNPALRADWPRRRLDLDVAKKSYPKRIFRTKPLTAKLAQAEVGFLELFRDSPFVAKFIGFQERTLSLSNQSKNPLSACWPRSQSLQELWIVTELFSESSSIKFDYIARYQNTLRIADIKTIVSSVLLGLDFIASKGFCHRDVKPGNILLKWSNKKVLKAVLCDFGACSEIIQTKLWKGTLSFLAPEYLALCTETCELKEFLKTKPDVTLKRVESIRNVDSWALGITLLGWVFGTNPFTKQSQKAVQELLIQMSSLSLSETSVLFKKESDWCMLSDIEVMFIKRYREGIKNRLKRIEKEAISESISSTDYVKTLFKMRSLKYPELMEFISECLTYDPNARKTVTELLDTNFVKKRVVDMRQQFSE